MGISIFDPVAAQGLHRSSGLWLKLGDVECFLPEVVTVGEKARVAGDSLCRG